MIIVLHFPQSILEFRCIVVASNGFYDVRHSLRCIGEMCMRKLSIVAALAAIGLIAGLVLYSKKSKN